MNTKTSVITLLILLTVISKSIGQVTGSPYMTNADELTVASFYSAEEVGDTNYLFTLIPFLNDEYFADSVSWSSSNPSLAAVDELGVATIVNHLDTTVTFRATSIASPDLVGAITIDISEVVLVDIIDEIEIVVNPSIQKRGAQPIAAFIQPQRRRDKDAIFTVSDPTILKIENDSITPLKDGVVTIYVTSSEIDTITSARTIVVANVTDLTPPIFCIDQYKGEDTIYVQRGTLTAAPQAIAKDEIDGELTVEITEMGLSFNGGVFGTYPIRYYAIDSSGNDDTIDVDVIIIDSLPPTLVFDVDTIEAGMTFEDVQGGGFVLPTVTATDDNGDVLVVYTDTAEFNPDSIGNYTIVYTAADPSGNVDTISVDVVIEMGFPPVITLSDAYTEGDTIYLFQNDTLTLPSATALDAVNNMVVVNLKTNGLDNGVAGLTTVNYIAEDRFGAMDTIDIHVNVKDNTPPEITNKMETRYLIINYDSAATPTFLTQILASDNIGVTSFTITEVGEAEQFGGVSPPDAMYEFLTNNGGNISIDNDGKITVTRGSFEAAFNFKINVYDALGNVDSTFIEVTIITIQPPDIEVKESSIDDWRQIGFNNIGEYDKTIQDNTPLGGEVLYFNALKRSFTTFDSFAISGGGSEDFELVDDLTDPGTSILKLKNALDINTQSSYVIQVDIYGYLNPGDTPSVVAVFFLNISVKSLQEISPVTSEIQNLLGSGVEFTLRNLFALYDASGLPTPSAALLGNELDEVFDVALLALPVIESGIDIVGAKRLISFLPYALWVTKETTPTSDTTSQIFYRIFLKFQKGPASYQMEYVMDHSGSQAYYTISVGSSKKGAGIQASTIHSSLAFLDHPRANLILTNTTVTKSNFKCVEVVSDLTLNSGVHFVARGNILPSVPSGLLNPVASFRIGLTEDGWTQPGIIVNMDLDPEFLAAFDDEIVDYILGASNVAKLALEQAIVGINIAKDNVHRGEYIFNQATAGVARIKQVIRRPQQLVNSYNAPLNRANTEISFGNTRISDLLDDEICTPGCWIPIYQPAWCSGGFFGSGYPCVKRVGCVGTEICVPDPFSIAQLPAWYAYLASWSSAKVSILAGRAGAVALLESVKIPLVPAEIAVDQARISVDALRLILIGLEQGLIVTIDGFGEVGKVAKFLIDKGGNLVESSSASIETSLDAANNGSFSGTLGFDLKFKGAAPVNFNVAFSFSDPAAVAEGVALSLID